MAIKLLIDTNIYVALMRGHESVVDTLRRSEEVIVSTVVAGELLFGFRHGSRYKQNRKAFDEFLESAFVTLVPITLETADRFARIAADLRRIGKPIPTHDIWIAAHADETGAELLSFDQHFAHVPGLAWTCPEE